MSQQRALRVDVVRRGGPEVLQVVEDSVPVPEPGEVRLRMLAAGISAYDRMERSHWLPGSPRPPYTPGLDVVGVVDALGAGVTEPVVGSVVAGGPYDRGGCYASHQCRAADTLVPVPEGVDPVEAVCLVTDYVTARHVMHDTAHVRPGERVLVHGAVSVRHCSSWVPWPGWSCTARPPRTTTISSQHWGRPRSTTAPSTLRPGSTS